MRKSREGLQKVLHSVAQRFASFSEVMHFGMHFAEHAVKQSDEDIIIPPCHQCRQEGNRDRQAPQGLPMYNRANQNIEITHSQRPWDSCVCYASALPINGLVCCNCRSSFIPGDVFGFLLEIGQLERLWEVEKQSSQDMGNVQE